MTYRFSDLRQKEVINIKNGDRLGKVGDIELQAYTATILSIIVVGRLKWFGLLGKEDDVIIPWQNIELIGEDTVLVSIEPAPGRRRESTCFKAKE